MGFNLTGASSISYIISSVITLSVVAVFVAILVDFINYNHKNAVKKAKRSIVATGSMIGFYFVYYLVLRYHLGSLNFANINVALIGTTLIVLGAIANIAGRVQLKGNWANHIKIYDGHSLVNRGVYKIVRHPLYASIMLMLFGGSIAYKNWLSAALTAFVFVPFMYYRAKQEEELLQEEFAEYENYKKTTGMFFPKFWR
jgi:protein-S-isoprenylcysteine O-methyltransferase Ste14